MLEVSGQLGCTLCELSKRMSAEEYALRVAFLRLKMSPSDDGVGGDQAGVAEEIGPEKQALNNQRAAELIL